MKADNDIRIKSPANLAWKAAMPGTAIYESDSLFSGQESSAQIELSGQGIIEMNSWSLIVLSGAKPDHAPAVRINYGEVSLKPEIATPWLVKIKNETLQVRANKSKSSLRISAKQKIVAVSEQGDFEVQANGVKQVLSQNQKAFSLDASPAPKVTLPPPQAEPTPTPSLTVAEAAATPAPTASPEPSVTPKILPSPVPSPPRKPTPRPAPTSTPVPTATSTPSPTPPPVQPTPLARRITLQSPVLYSPLDTATVFFPDRATGSLKFSWSRDAEARQYIIETALNNNFEKIIWTASPATNEARHIFGDAQKIFWRVKAIGGKENESPWSEIRSVRIGASPE